MPKKKQAATKPISAAEASRVEVTPKPAPPVEPKSYYFRNALYSGLLIKTGEQGFKITGYQFEPYYEVYQGDRVKVGYLKTDETGRNTVTGRSGVQEISEREYLEATQGKKSRKAPQPRN